MITKLGSFHCYTSSHFYTNSHCWYQRKSIENSKENMGIDVRLSRVKANYTNLDHVSRSQSCSFKEHTGKIFGSFILFVSFHSFQKFLDQWMSWVNLQCSLLVGIISERNFVQNQSTPCLLRAISLWVTKTTSLVQGGGQMQKREQQSIIRSWFWNKFAMSEMMAVTVTPASLT